MMNQNNKIILYILYIVSRRLSYHCSTKHVPSTTKIMKWQFILEGEKNWVLSEKQFFGMVFEFKKMQFITIQLMVDNK